MRTSARLVFTAALALVAVNAGAATPSIDKIKGKVTVNRGQGFQTIVSATPGTVGDAVMVGVGSSAVVIYEDNCRVTVNPGKVVHIKSKSPCTPGSFETQVNKAGTFETETTKVEAAETAEGVPEGPVTVDPVAPVGTPPVAGVPAVPVVVVATGAVVLGAGILLVTLNSNPASQ